jgi:Secretion system C-terminal sorting domain
VWNGTQDTVYSLGRVSGFYQPRLFSDGNNGAIYVWHDDRNSTNITTGYIQRKNSSGAIQFPVNGSAVSTNASNHHFAPVAAYMPSTGETYAVFQEANSGQTQWGFYAQRFSPTGSQLWTSGGLALQTLGTDQVVAYTVMTRDTNVIFCFSQSAAGNTNIVKAARLGKSGGYVWSGNIISASTVSSSKIRLNSVINSSGMSILNWQDKRLDGGGVYAQNINFDGTFGPFSGVINLGTGIPASYKLEQNYPNPFNPETSIQYSITRGSEVKLVIFDMLGREVRRIVDEFQNAGTYRVGLNSGSLASGVYMYKISADGFTDTKKMILLK